MRWFAFLVTVNLHLHPDRPSLEYAVHRRSGNLVRQAPLMILVVGQRAMIVRVRSMSLVVEVRPVNWIV